MFKHVIIVSVVMLASCAQMRLPLQTNGLSVSEDTIVEQFIADSAWDKLPLTRLTQGEILPYLGEYTFRDKTSCENSLKIEETLFSINFSDEDPINIKISYIYKSPNFSNQEVLVLGFLPDADPPNIYYLISAHKEERSIKIIPESFMVFKHTDNNTTSKIDGFEIRRCS